MSETNFFLSLGDVIQLTAPTNLDINNHIYLIDYIDDNKLRLIDATDLDNPSKIEFTLVDGNLSDETIEEIAIIDRASEKGFARQKGLLPDTWLDIYFGGDVPIVITGKIGSLEEDMIEVITHPEHKHIFIDFAYKGIPSNLPITEINIRDPPSTSSILTRSDAEEEVAETAEDSPLNLQKFIAEGDEIVFGAEEEMTQIIDVKEGERRFGISQQSEDLLDELLAVIPTNQRTNQTMNNIHQMIARFKELRQAFSIFDEWGNPVKPLVKGANYRPLLPVLQKLNQKLYWILPVVRNRRKIYYGDREDLEDVVPLSLANVRENVYTLEQQYKQNVIPGDENKYVYLMRALNPYWTPVSPPTGKSESLSNQNVDANIHVIVSNKDDFLSSTYGTELLEGARKPISLVHDTRFVLETYTLGLTRLSSVRETPRKTTIQRTPMTSNDSIDIKTFLTFPIQVVKYSKINLPLTTILERVHLNQVNMNYWQLLKERTRINIVEAGNNEHFIKGIQDIQSDGGVAEGSGEDAYYNYLESLIPKTKKIFNLIKDSIRHPYSLTSILEEMEPFMVYDNDLSFKQYKQMIRFIAYNIRNIKVKIIEKKHENENYVDKKYRVHPREKPFAQEVAEYAIPTTPWWLYSTSEILAEMLNSDGARVATIQLSLTDINLYGHLDMDVVGQRIAEVNSHLQHQEANNTCQKYTLAKRYIDIEELQEDNNKDIFFDKQYDESRYDIITEVGKKRAQMDQAAFRSFVRQHLEKLGVTENLERETEALLSGRRRVIDGDFAMLMLDDFKMQFYKRTNNAWIRADELDGKDWVNIFCNLQDKCLKIKDTCNDENVNHLLIKKQLIEEVVLHFENENNLSRDRLQQQLNRNLVLYKRKLASREALQQYQLLKYDLYKYQLGLLDIQTERIVSPRAELRELILMQTDFIKKQSDIINFVARFCRPGEGDEESPYWYYDAELGVPLLPTFLNTLAVAFEEDRYQEVVEQIAAKQGHLSDSGDAVVDKYSGYIIKPLDLVILEAYDEKGFRIVSHDLLEKSMEDILASQEPVRTFESEDAKKVYHVVQAMSKYLFVKIDAEATFIIKNVLEALRKALPSENAYNKAMAGKKKAKSYKFAKDFNLVLLTLCFMTIVLQTMIPTIVVSKTFPGCRRSFDGFPFNESNGDGFLEYIACIIYNIKLEGSPWKTLKVRKKKGVDRALFKKKIRSELVNKLKSYITKYVLPIDNIQDRIADKQEYLTTYADIDEIPAEHNITYWLTFLPPLRPLKLTPKKTLAPSFIQNLFSLMNDGNIEQEKNLSIIQGRVIFHALSIIQSIQRVVNKEAPLLKNSLDEPFLENVCCNIGAKNTIKYFSQRESLIEKNDEQVRTLEKTLSMVRYLTIGPYLFDARDTRYHYPPISNVFSERTIYKAFIRYCQFNSGIMLSEGVKSICIDNKSEFLITHTFEEKMEILKREGKRYTLDHFYQLMNIIETQNQVRINLEPEVLSARPMLENLLNGLDEEDIQHTLLTMFRDSLDFIEIETTAEDEIMSKINRYLNLSIDELSEKIYKFLSDHGTLSSTQMTKINRIIRALGDWRERGEGIIMSKGEETDSYVGGVFHNNILSIMNIYPQIIENQVDYEDVHIPAHWHLSPNHVGDIQSIITREFSNLRTFYADKELMGILLAASEKSQYITRVIDILPLFIKTADASVETNILFGARTYRNIMHFYYLTILDEIILQGGESIVIKKRKGTLKVPDFGKAKNKRLKKPVLTEVDIVTGEAELVDQNVAKYIISLLKHFESQKKILNMNNAMITERTLKMREKEKNRVTTNFQDLSIQQREIEKIMMNHRLGEWGVGLTRALYVYDQDQYEKERERLEKEALEEIKLGKMGADTEMTRSIYKLDLIAEEQAEKASWDEAFNISDLPDDDDYGEKDGDEHY